MNNPDTELLFPLRIVHFLADSLDTDWKSLVEFVGSKQSGKLDQLGFVFTMAKLAGCVSCNSDSFRAMRGCTQCALQTVRRQHLGGSELHQLFEQTKAEVEKYLEKRCVDEVQPSTEFVIVAGER